MATIRVAAYQIDPETSLPGFIEAEWIDRGDGIDTVTMTRELYDDANDRWFIRPVVPYIGAFVSLCGIRMKIVDHGHVEYSAIKLRC